MSAWAMWGLLAALAGGVPGEASAKIPGIEIPPADLVADLPWAFTVTIEAVSDPQEAARITRYRFTSAEPYSTSSAGDVYLRLALSVLEYDDTAGAEAAFEDLLATADPDTGLSYAWDYVVLQSSAVFHLHAPCLLSADHFRRLVSRLEAALPRQPTAAPPRTFSCRCGGGCRHSLSSSQSSGQ